MTRPSAKEVLTGEGSMFYSDRGSEVESSEVENGSTEQIGARERLVDKYVGQYGLEKGLEVARLVLG